MTKTLLVLAASLYQLDTIQRAKELGFRVITLDNRPQNPGHVLAAKSYIVDTTDREAVLSVARQERIDGIIAPCTDVAVPTAAYVARSMKLTGVPVECAAITCSKILFREFLKRQGFPVPASIRITSGSEAASIDFGQGPWILKPDRSSGSKGIFVVHSAAEYRARLPETLSFSPSGEAILERFIDGFQGTCEGILQGGSLVLTFILDRQTAPKPYVTTCGHHLPTRLPENLQQALRSMLEKVWGLLGVWDGPFDCDFVASADDIYLLEISPRMGGNSISTLLRKAADFDIVEYSVRHALGERTDLQAFCRIRPTAVILFGVFEAGGLGVDLSELMALRKEPWVDSLSLDVEPGDAVMPFIDGRHRVGQAVIYGSTREDLDAKVVELKRRLCLHAVRKKQD